MRKSIVLSICLVLAVVSFGFGDPEGGPSQPRPVAEGAAPAPVTDAAPAPVDTATKINCLGVAAYQLRAAGMEELAMKVFELLRLEQRTLREGELARKLAELKSLREDVDRLRRLAGIPAQLVIHMRIVEIDRRKLPVPDGKDAALSVPPFDAPFAGIRDLETLDAHLKELRGQGVINVLSRPLVRALIGQYCAITVGSQFPRVKPAGVTPATGVSDIVEMPGHGIKVEIVPHFLGGDRLRLEITAGVSTPDMSNAVTVDGQTFPGLKVHRINTQIELDAGLPCILDGLRTDGPDGEKEVVILMVAESIASPSE